MDKNTEISERIIEMIDFLGVTKNDFAKNLHYNRSQAIYDITNGKAKPSFDFFEKLLNSEYSELINVEYLITGIGFLSKTKSEKNVTVLNSNNNGNKNGNKPKVKDLLPFPEKEKGERMLAVPLGSGLGVPLIPIDAMAGYGQGETTVLDYETSRYMVPEFEELHVDFMISVKGSSMYPKYNSGDIVACKKLSLNDIFFQWNKVYVLDTTQGALIKRIKKGSDKDHILLVSDNLSYDPFEIHLNKIRAISLVIGVIRLE